MNNTVKIQETQLFSMAYESMPYQFSSIKYCKKLKEFGYTDKEILNERHFQYLLGKCKRIGRTMWSKKQVTDSEAIQKQNVIVFDKPQQEFTIENCAAFLKKNGCKVLIPVTDYKEF